MPCILYMFTAKHINSIDVCCSSSQARQEESIKALLEDNERLMTIEIHPLFLIPDTNCFIDHLKGIQKLLQSERYTLVVPLVGKGSLM